MPIVYTCFCTDIIHDGHLNIINEAKKYGDVIVGVLNDKSMIKFNKFPLFSFEDRFKMVQKIEGVKQVIIQDEIMYDNIVNKLKPDYIIHGDNWKYGAMQAIRNNVFSLMNKYNGKVIEIPYTYNENILLLDSKIKEKRAMPEYRRKRLKQLLKLRDVIKVLEVHNGLTGLIVEKTIVESNGELDQFDAMWLSSLCDSTAKGKPDIELVDMTSRFNTVNEILDVTTKPIIFDGDTGGKIEHFVYTVRTLERLGVSAVIVEDKIGLKKNSLLGLDVEQQQDTIEHFCEKISAAKKIQLTDDFMVIARIESLILKKGIDDAINRANSYVKAGADAIMIHSKEKSADEVFEFCDKFRINDKVTPLVAVPTTYNYVTEEQLYKHGVNIVIYANQLTRSCFPAMEQTAKDILKYHRAKEVDDKIMPIKDIISLIDEL